MDQACFMGYRLTINRNRNKKKQKTHKQNRRGLRSPAILLKVNGIRYRYTVILLFLLKPSIKAEPRIIRSPPKV